MKLGCSVEGGEVLNASPSAARGGRASGAPSSDSGRATIRGCMGGSSRDNGSSETHSSCCQRRRNWILRMENTTSQATFRRQFLLAVYVSYCHLNLDIYFFFSSGVPRSCDCCVSGTAGGEGHEVGRPRGCGCGGSGQMPPRTN